MTAQLPRILAASVALTLAAALTPARAELIYGVTGANQLVSFDSANPNLFLSNVAISGATILNIDIRPATGVLYGLSDVNSLYTLDLTSGLASLVGATGISGGFDYGFDFNPQVDRLRVVIDDATDDNFRLLPTTGAIAFTDGDLNYATGDANFGDNPNIVGAAYTANRPSTFGVPGLTQLFYIDSDNDVLANTTDPNNGVLNTVGSLGVDTTGLVGFDISGLSNVAYASLSTDGTNSLLYTIALTGPTAGTATPVGGIGSATGTTVLDIAAPIPEPTTAILGGIGAFALLGRRRARQA